MERISASDAAFTSRDVARYLFAAEHAPGASVLDVGTGAGYGARLLAGAGARDVTGIDRDPAAVAAAKESFEAANLRFLVGDCSEDLPGGTYALVTCFEVIEHVRDDEGLMRLLARATDSEGALILSTPNASAFEGGHSGNPFHLREYTREEIVNLARRHFSSVETHYQSWSESPFARPWSLGLLLRLFLPIRMKHAWRLLKPKNVRSLSTTPGPRQSGAGAVHPAAYLTWPGLRALQPAVWVLVCRTPHRGR